jgi:VWFA-related protein
MLSRLAGALAAPLLAGGFAASLPQGPTAGIGAEIVRLDVVVTDARGNPVPNLTRGDFEVLEDGRPQRITNFVLVVRRPATSPEATAQPPPASEAPAETAAGPIRHIVIVVDDLHMARESVDPAKAALRRFVAAQVAPDDKVALVATSSPAGLQPLTQDRAVLQLAIGRISSRDTVMSEARGSQMSPAQAELILRGDQDALRLATRLLMDEPGSTLNSGGPRATVEATDGATPAGLDPGEKAAAREAQREARGVLAGALRFSQISLITVDEVLRGLVSLPGRKLCLLVSDGFLIGKGTSEEQTQLLRQVTDAATRSGAVIYALDAHGLTPTAADASVFGPVTDPGLRERVVRLARQESRATLQRLTDDTGGILVSGANGTGAGLGRMLADNEAYYLIAYEPASTKRDGRYRKIELRLPRHPNLAVRTRRGYLAPDERKQGRAALRAGAALPPLVANPNALAETEVRAALSAPLPPNGIPVSVSADYLDLPPEGPQAIVQALVDLAGLTWRETDGRHRADIEVLGGFYDATGSPAGLPFGRRFELDLGDAEYRQVTREGLRYAHRRPLSPGRYELRIMAREAVLGPLGGATHSIEVPDLGEKKLTLSSLFVSTSSADAGPGAGEGGESLHDAQLVRRFKRSDSLYFQLYVYNALADVKGATDVVLQAQIRSGGDAIAASKPQVVVFQRKNGGPLPQSNSTSLESLDPGRYELRVVVVDRKADATASRSVSFSVE